MTGVLTSAARISVETSVEGIGRAEWTALADACDAPVFSRYDFLRSVERDPLTYPSQAYYIVARDGDGGLLAALPVYHQRTRDPFSAEPGGGPVLDALVGHVWHCYDTALPSRIPLDRVLVERFWSELCALAGALDTQLWGLVNLPLDGDLWHHLDGLGVPVAETAPRYRLRVAAGADLDEHLAGVGRESRRTMRKFVRRAERDGVRVVRIRGAEGLDDQALALCLATADKHAPGYYPPDRLAALIRRLGDACRLIRVELDGVLLAVSICMYDTRRMHAWAGGCRYPAGLNWSPQYVLFAAELETAFATGLPELECGRRNDGFKTRYGLRPQRLGRAVLGADHGHRTTTTG